MRLPALTLIAGLLLACSNDPQTDFALGERTVRVSEAGVELIQLDGASGFALAPGQGPIVRRFDETVVGPLGIYDFRRRNEVTTPTLATGDATTREGALSIEYGGNGDAGEIRGTLTIEAESATRTRFTFRTDDPVSSIAIPVRCDEGGSFHGFGEQYNARDLRGQAFDLVASEQGLGRGGALRQIEGDAHTTYFPMPYWLDGRGHGVLFRTNARVHVDLCSSDESVAWIEVVASSPVEWVVFGGPTPLDVIRQLGEEVGVPAPLPEWAYGLWIGSQGGREAVLAEVDALEAANVPVSAFWVQDWTGRRMNFGGGFGVQYRWEADEEFYPDLPGLVSELRARGYRFLAYANPFVDPALPNHFDEMASADLLLRNAAGEPYVFAAPNGMSAHPDLMKPEARAYVVNALRMMIREYGFDGWMQDFSEWTPFDAFSEDGTTGAELHHRFVVEWQAVAREAFAAERPDGDHAFFGRAGFTGVQAVAQIHWVGDQEATFEPGDGLPTVVPAMLGLGLAGQPNVTHDIAGFSGGPSTKELFMRWTELGAFTPIMRTHEGNAREQNWSWERDAETTAHFRRFARIHELLRPTFVTLAERSQATSRPMVEHLMLAFPADRATWNVDDEFLLGDLLVAPISEAGATRRSVYLPEGEWFHVWTGERFSGPITVTVDAPIGEPPVFSLNEDRTDLRAVE